MGDEVPETTWPSYRQEQRPAFAPRPAYSQYPQRPPEWTPPAAKAAPGRPATPNADFWNVGYQPPPQDQPTEAWPTWSQGPRPPVEFQRPPPAAATQPPSEVASPWHVPSEKNEGPEIQQAIKLLKKSGYVQLAALVEDDAARNQLGQSDVVAAHQRVGQQFVSAAKRLGTKENPLASYKNFVNLYSSFWNWTLSAIESVRGSLKEIAYVVMVELWSRLLSLCLKRAAAFLRRFAEGHFANHRDEILEMRKIQSLQCVKDLPFVSRILRAERFHVRVDYLTRKLLTTRLTLDNDTVILDILQKRVSFDLPGDTGSNQPSIATLASNHFKSVAAQDLGGAMVTPSLAILCGLLPNPLDRQWDERIVNAEPTATFMQRELASLYRLPFGNTQSLTWRHRLSAQRTIDSILRRSPVTTDKLPSLLNMSLSATTVWPGVGEAAPGSLDVISLDRNSGELLASSDRSTCGVWVWKLRDSQWQQCSELYKREIFNPWLRRYAQTRDPIKQQEDDLEEAGVYCQLGSKSVTILGSKMDYGLSSPGANDDLDTFIEGLEEPALLEEAICPVSLNGHSLPVTGFSFLPPFLMGGAACLGLSGSYDGRMCLWDINNAFRLHTYRSGSAVLSVDSDPNFGYNFLSGHQDRAACLWTMDRSSPLRVLNRHCGHVSVVKFHPNSILVSTGSTDHRVRLWDSRVADIVGLIHDVRNPNLISWSPNGKYLVVSGTDRPTLQVWDMVASKLLNTFTIGGTSDFATSISVAHGSEILAATTAKGLVQLWDMCGTVSQTGRGVEEETVEVLDLNGTEENLALVNELKDMTRRCKLAEYEYHDQQARMVSFTNLNLLLSVTT